MSATLRDILRKLLNEDVSEEDVLDAVDNKYHVSIHYGDKGGRRIIQPMAYGSTSKGPVVRAFQVSGPSESGKPTGWKFFRTDSISKWTPMRNKHFSEPPDDSYGVYNRTGDKSMSLFVRNSQFSDDESPLERERRRGREMLNAPKMSTKNTSGPINATQQWKKNVFTSQPNSARYAQYAKNIKDTEDDLDRFDDDIWTKAESERNIQDTERLGNGPILGDDERDEFYDDDYNMR